MKKSVVILIDDDQMMHFLWKKEAARHDVQFMSFSTVDEYIKENLTFYEKDAVYFYVDSTLGENLKGEIESEKIAKLGFENIFLATGKKESDFDSLPSWIKGVVGKKPQFD